MPHTENVCSMCVYRLWASCMLSPLHACPLSNYKQHRSCKQIAAVDRSGAYLPSLLTPGSPSLSVPPSPSLVAELQEKAGDSLGSSHSSSTARDAGPRIFVGKLVRGTTENDVRDYFSKFG